FYEAADGESEQLSSFVQAWAEKFGDKVVTVSDLLTGAALPAGLDVGPAKDPHAQKIRLGLFLKAQEERIIDGYRVSKAGKSGNSTRWRLVPAKIGGVGRIS